MGGDPGTESDGTHVLVADDSPIYRKLVESTLDRHGYSVSFAKNGREAIAAVFESHPTVLITDWEMPDFTGIELCRRIRSDENSSFTYVILLTGKTHKDQLIEGLAAGADDYLTKPFHPGELLARVAVGQRMAELHRQIQTKNRLLEELARTDPLTGLPNRRAIEEWAVRALKGAARHGFPFWVVMADLDHFKSINDTYGHETGDLVLQRFAQVLRINIRSSDICGRLGGEEFAAIITHGERAGIYVAIDRLREQLAREHFEHSAASFQATASFGIAGFEGHHQAPTFQQLLRDADAALYAAKRTGRNRVEFAMDCLQTTAVG
jgi:two-component system, cell cycle response regulator